MYICSLHTDIQYITEMLVEYYKDVNCISKIIKSIFLARTSN